MGHRCLHAGPSQERGEGTWGPQVQAEEQVQGPGHLAPGQTHPLGAGAGTWPPGPSQAREGPQEASRAGGELPVLTDLTADLLSHEGRAVRQLLRF